MLFIRGISTEHGSCTIIVALTLKRFLWIPQVYAGDSFYPPFEVNISNFFIVPITFKPMDTLVNSMDLAIQQLQSQNALLSATIASQAQEREILSSGVYEGKTFLMNGMAPLTRGNLVAFLDIPLDYEIGFTIQPTEINGKKEMRIVYMYASSLFVPLGAILTSSKMYPDLLDCSVASG